MGEPCTRSEETGSCAGSGTLLSSHVVAEMSVAGLVEHGLVHHGLVRLCEVVAGEHQELGQGAGGDHQTGRRRDRAHRMQRRATGRDSIERWAQSRGESGGHGQRR